MCTYFIAGFYPILSCTCRRVSPAAERPVSWLGCQVQGWFMPIWGWETCYGLWVPAVLHGCQNPAPTAVGLGTSHFRAMVGHYVCKWGTQLQSPRCRGHHASLGLLPGGHHVCKITVAASPGCRGAWGILTARSPSADGGVSAAEVCFLPVQGVPRTGFPLHWQ